MGNVDESRVYVTQTRSLDLGERRRTDLVDETSFVQENDGFAGAHQHCNIEDKSDPGNMKD